MTITTVNQLKDAMGVTQAPKQKQKDDVFSLIQKMVPQIKMALPSHVTAERLARVAMTEVRKNPKLGIADPASFMGALMQCAQLGLEPGGALGHAYLLPFDNRRLSKTEVQFIIGYKGMIDLARRSGQIISLTAHEVYENDDFDYEYGLSESLVHKPHKTNRGKNITHVYAVAKLHGGGVQFEVMSKEDVDLIKVTSKSAGKESSPWHTAYNEMAKKTVIRRLFKYLPMSIEIQRAVTLDERSDEGLSQADIMGDFSIIDHETGEILNAEQPADEDIPQ